MSLVSLDQISVAEPCHVDWNEMKGNSAARFCEHCQKTVHDLSAMPREQAEKLVCQSAGSLCIRITKGPDGVVQTLDYRGLAGPRRWTWRAWTLVALAVALMAGVVNAAIFGRRVMPPAPVAATLPPLQQQMMMGVMLPTPRLQAPSQTTNEPTLCPRPGSHG
jgi:hypothetical protein